jgi:hypothetical protein
MLPQKLQQQPESTEFTTDFLNTFAKWSELDSNFQIWELEVMRSLIDSYGNCLILEKDPSQFNEANKELLLPF